MKQPTVFTLILFIITTCSIDPQKGKKPDINMDKFADGMHHWYLFAEDTDYERLDSNDYESIADNIVKFQNEDGGWPKNMDWLAIMDIDSLKNTLSAHDRQSTFDNFNTHPQIEFLAKMYTITGTGSYKQSAAEGLQYILNTQDESGGWRGWDVDAITYNDNVMIGIMNVLLDIKQNESHYDWLSDSLRTACLTAYERALDVTLACQIQVNDTLKGWGQQYDHKTLQPVQGRSYELPGVASRESVNIVEFLMEIRQPDTRVVRAVEGAVDWMKRSGLENIRIDTIPISPDTYPGQNLDIDRKAVTDSSAPTIWARYYEIEDNTPFFCTRSGEKVYSLAEVNPERRGGYEWYGYWPAPLIGNKYPAWKNRIQN